MVNYSTVDGGGLHAGALGSDPPLAGLDAIGEYRVTGVLGRGGMGTVYAGVHRSLDKPVAIKVLHKRDGLDRLVQEARLVNRIGHPNIVNIFDFGKLADGSPYIVMELLAGRPLSAFLSQRAPLSYADALPVLRGIGLALDAGHKLGIVHRDLKPENVFIHERPDRDPEIKVLDFGIAKPPPGDDQRTKTRSGITIGSPHYMSPEQCAGSKEIDIRADIYSFGVVAYLIFTGRLPFEAESTPDLLYSHLRAKPLRPSFVSGVPPALEGIILRALEKRPQDRYQRLADLLDDLAAIPPDERAWVPRSRRAREMRSNDGPSTEALAARRTIQPETPSTPTGNGRKMFAVGFLAGALVTLAAGLAGLHARRTTPKPLAIAESSEAIVHEAPRRSWFRAATAAGTEQQHKPSRPRGAPVDLYEDW